MNRSHGKPYFSQNSASYFQYKKSGRDFWSHDSDRDCYDCRDHFNIIQGTAGPDKLHGTDCNDIIFGDGPAKYEQRVLDFTAAATWLGVPSGATSMELPMLTVSSTNGSLAPYFGAGILSPSDNAAQRWTFEIDSYNDQPEILHLDFDCPQTQVIVTVNLLYREPILLVEAEKVLVTLRFEDGSSTTTGITASPTGGPLGEATLTLNAADFGGRKIVGVDLQADPSLAVVPPSQQAQWGNHYNVTHPYSEFTLKSVAYTRDVSKDDGNDDVICGGKGNDILWGGYGDDVLDGGKGKDVLIGGRGDNILTGGQGDDFFLFGTDASGSNVITDYEKRGDKIVLQGVTVTGWFVESGDGILTLSNGGEIILEGITNPNNLTILYF